MKPSRLPPRLAVRLIERLLPAGDFREALLGDLQEEFLQAKQRTRSTAALWYWWHLVLLLPSLLRTGALLQRGQPTRRKESIVDTLRNDVRFALRMLRRRRAFAFIALFTIALGIGSATAIFSVVDGVLLRSLPFPAPDQLVSVYRSIPRWRDDPLFKGTWEQVPLAWPEFREFRDQQSTFVAAGGWLLGSETISDDNGPQLAEVLRATGSLLTVLGLAPRVGRTFRVEEEGWPVTRVVMITEELWRSRYGSRPDITSQSVTLSGDRYAIIGVLPAGLHVPRLQQTPGYWVPAGSRARDTTREDLNYETIARLRSGVTMEQARLEAARIFRFGGPPEAGDARLASLQADAVKNVRPPFLLLLTAAGLLLFISCVNVAALMLGENASRDGELASRMALGAARGRLIQQLLTEQVVLALGGALLGLLFAHWATRMLVALAPPGTPRLDEVAVNWRSALFALAAALSTALLFGVAPAFTLVQGNVSAVLRSTRMSQRRGRLQRTAVAVQLALAVVLLAGATLLVRSLLRLRSEPVGFRAQRLVHVQPFLGANYAQSLQQRAFFTQVLASVAALPGVEAATVSSSVPFTDGGSGTTIEIDHDGTPQKSAAQWRVVMPQYLQTLGLPLLEGRDFTPADNAGSARVTLVSASLARSAWPGRSAVGQRLRVDNEWREVVGVVGDVRFRSLAQPLPATFYLPAEQTRRAGFDIVLRVNGDPAAAIAAVRQRIHIVDPTVAIFRAEVVSTLIERTLAPQRFRTAITAFFAIIAALLTGAGLYGVASDAVMRRLREMAIRMALGASGTSVVRLMVRATTTVGLAGALAGVLGARLGARALRPFLYQVGPADPLSYLLVSAAALLLTMLAAWIPARRAARTQPAELLRSD